MVTRTPGSPPRPRSLGSPSRSRDRSLRFQYFPVSTRPFCTDWREGDKTVSTWVPQPVVPSWYDRRPQPRGSRVSYGSPLRGEGGPGRHGRESSTGRCRPTTYVTCRMYAVLPVLHHSGSFTRGTRPSPLHSSSCRTWCGPGCLGVSPAGARSPSQGLH